MRLSRDFFEGVAVGVGEVLGHAVERDRRRSARFRARAAAEPVKRKEAAKKA